MIVIRAEGEAEAAAAISDALKEHGDGLIHVRRIDAAKVFFTRKKERNAQSRSVTLGDYCIMVPES